MPMANGGVHGRAAMVKEKLKPRNNGERYENTYKHSHHHVFNLGIVRYRSHDWNTGRHFISASEDKSVPSNYIGRC